jgi:nitrogen fixation protein FixH
VAEQYVRFRLRVAEAGRPVVADRVRLRLTMPHMDHGVAVVPLRAVGGGMYEGRGVFVMGGRWRVEAEGERSGGTWRAGAWVTVR